MSFKNLFRHSSKDHGSSSSAPSGETKRPKSIAAPGSPSLHHPTSSLFAAPLHSSSTGSLPVSPLSHPVELPAIDVVDLSDTKPSESVESTPIASTNPFNSGVKWDGFNSQQSNGKAMPRSSSTGHGYSKNEPALSIGGGKTSRRGSKIDKSEDGHGKPEPLNRHELMRRAMATAQDPLGQEDDDDSVFDDDEHSHHSHAAPSVRNSLPPSNSTPTTARKLSVGSDVHGQAPRSSPPATNSFSVTPSVKQSRSASTSPSLTSSSTMPTLITPSPVRAEMPRSDSLEEVLNQGTLSNRSQSVDLPSPQRASTYTENAASPPKHSAAMTKSATSGALLHPADAMHDASPRRPSDSSSVRNLSPVPFQRHRKNSDASIATKSGKPKRNGSVVGIAGALAASGVAGMGVGHAAAVQQGKAAVSHPDDASLSASRAANKQTSSSENGDRPPGQASQGGVYQSSGAVTQDASTQRAAGVGRDRSVSSLMSLDSTATSERSSASGLGAAAGFGVTSAALLASIGGASGVPVLPSVSHDGPVRSASLDTDSHMDGDTSWPDDVGPQITGFAVASSKRNNEFHQLFSQVPEDDYLIEDYGCALVRDILIQGRLYISENHLCFKANIFGWVTNVVVPFSDVVSIEKRMTAFVIPNAIQIATLNAKHNFTSFLSRDATYDLIVNIWKLSHPGVTIAAADQAELSDDYSEVDDDGASVGHSNFNADGETINRDDGENKPSKRARLKRKFKGTKHGVRDENLAAVGAAAARSGTPMLPKSRSPAPGGKRAAHRKTTCACEEKKGHFSTTALDTTYPTVPEKVYNLLFTSGFMKDFWEGNQKLFDLEVSDWSPDSQNSNNLSRKISYIKPLAGGFGPKQTKCHLVDETTHVEFDNYVTTLTTTTTPDVPSGGSFSVKTKTCITWEGSGNVSHILVTCQVEWTGRSMIKGIIEKACIDGQKQYYKDLDAAVRKYLTEHTSEFKEEGDDDAAVDEIARAATPGGNRPAATPTEKEANSDGGQGGSASNSGSSGFLGRVWDMTQDLLAPVGDLVGGATGMLTGEGAPSVKTTIMTIIILVLLLSNLYTWRKAPASSSSGSWANLYQMQKQGRNQGYFDDRGYYGPMSPRHESTSPSFERIFAPNVYITPPDGSSSPEVIAATVKEVLTGLLSADVSGQMSFNRDKIDPESIERLLKDAEARVERLKREMQGYTKAGTTDTAQATSKKPKKGKAEL